MVICDAVSFENHDRVDKMWSAVVFAAILIKVDAGYKYNIHSHPVVSNQNSQPQIAAQYSTSHYNTVQSIPKYPARQPLVQYQTHQVQQIQQFPLAPQVPRPVYQTQQLQQGTGPAYFQQPSRPVYQTLQIRQVPQPANTQRVSIYQTHKVVPAPYFQEVSQPVYKTLQTQLVQHNRLAYAQNQVVSHNNVEDVAKLTSVTVDVEHHDLKPLTNNNHEQSDSDYHRENELIKFEVAGVHESHEHDQNHDSYGQHDNQDPYGVKNIAKLTSVTIDVHDPSEGTDTHEQQPISIEADVAQQQYHHSRGPYNAPALITKHVYFHVPPADIEERQRSQQVLSVPKRNYKIIFIKVPSQESRDRALVQRQLQGQLATASEEKTLIYVLSENPEELVQPPVASPVLNIPEVFYVKYQESTSFDEVVNQISEQH